MVEQIAFTLRRDSEDPGTSSTFGLDQKIIAHRNLCQHLGNKGLRHIATFLVKKVLDKQISKLDYQSICNFQFWDDVYSGMLRQWLYIEHDVPWSPVISIVQLAALFDESYEEYIKSWPADSTVLAIAENLKGSEYDDALERARSWGRGDYVTLMRYMGWLETYQGWRTVRDGSPWVVYDYHGEKPLPEYL
ncbi:hypothetical protein TWF694_004362 [Orbilia ellipsospora]|uniref:Uncharacterized protein n=1 Tax=Orbilia ellipsospora TaxID=2528407 RepID=A0AAV9WZ43_9PEZI